MSLQEVRYEGNIQVRMDPTPDVDQHTASGEAIQGCATDSLQGLLWRDGEETGDQDEYRDACKKRVLESSAVAEHAWKEHHTIRWEETSIVNESLSLLHYACGTHTLRLWYTCIALPVHMCAHCVCLHCACVALVLPYVYAALVLSLFLFVNIARSR